MVALNKVLPITITNVSINNTFRIDGNGLYSYSNNVNPNCNINNLFRNTNYSNINVTATNGFGTDTKELKFINIDYNNPIIDGLSDPTSNIVFTNTRLTSNADIDVDAEMPTDMGIPMDDDEPEADLAVGRAKR
jgi:hypothetical protein